jgi:hypothetical protein
VPRRLSPIQVIPTRIAEAVCSSAYWFVIGGQAIRCFCPYRPSNDVDFGVARAKDADDLLRQLRRQGRVELLERTEGTTHLQFDGINVSVFVLPELGPHVEEQALSVTGVLATKLHAILDRGTRRDFFDLYVMLHQHQFGIVECLRAIREVYAIEVNEGLLLRALTYFDDADREPRLPGEGAKDWETVRTFFTSRVAAALLPPGQQLAIQARVVDVHRAAPKKAGRAPRRAGKKRR